MTRPVPVPDAGSAPYWEAAAAHELALPRCRVCGAFALPPEPVCPHCHATAPDYSYELVSSAGAVRSWTVVRQSFLPGFDDLVPFVLVDVELAAQPGLRMIGRLVDGPEHPLGLGTAVSVVFEDLGDGTAVPAFAADAP